MKIDRNMPSKDFDFLKQLEAAEEAISSHRSRLSQLLMKGAGLSPEEIAELAYLKGDDGKEVMIDLMCTRDYWRVLLAQKLATENDY